MTLTAPAPAPAVPSYRVALLRLAAAETNALAAFAVDLGHNVDVEVPDDGPTRYYVTATTGKRAVLTHAGHDAPAPVLRWIHPTRPTGMKPRDALLSMRLTTTTPAAR